MAGDFGAFVGVQVLTGAVEHLPQRFGDAVGTLGLQHFLDLPGGAAVGVAFDCDRDLLPGGDVAAIEGRPDR